MRRKDPSKTKKKKWQEQKRRKDPNKTQQKNCGSG
jgi:hypothetical protein